jgi:hypothetical protein
MLEMIIPNIEAKNGGKSTHATKTIRRPLERFDVVFNV